MTLEKPLHCLCDTGTSASIMVQDSMVKHENTHHKKKETIWKMAGGDCKTSKTTSVDFESPDFSKSCKIQWNFYISNDKNNDHLGHGVIIGQDLMQGLGMKIDFKKHESSWKELTIPMCNHGELEKGDKLNLMFLQLVELEVTQHLEHRAQRMANAECEKVDVVEHVNKQMHLTLEEKNDLFNLLIKCQDTLFSKGLGCMEGLLVFMDLKPGEEKEPVQSHPFATPHMHLETLKKEIA